MTVVRPCTARAIRDTSVKFQDFQCGCLASRQMQRLQSTKSRRDARRSSSIGVSAASYAEVKESGDVTKKPSLEQPTQAVGKEPFAWLKNWYPVSNVADLTTAEPSAHTLLNIKLVVWRDSSGSWAAAEDRCPHRLAPLSEGRIQDGNLACNYHGWQFDRQGACLLNPQSGQSASDPACRSKGAKARAFPTQVVQGMLWVWPESGPHAWLDSAMQSPAVIPELEDPTWPGSKGDVFATTMMCNWDIAMENTMDPSHANWLHDGFAGKWEDAAVMTMRLAENQTDPKQGFLVTHDGYSKKQQAAGLKVSRKFTPPCTTRHEYQYKDGSEMLAALYFVPSSPGRTRVFGKFLFRKPGKRNSMLSLAEGIFSRIPAGFKHNLFSGRMTDQDALMLHGQDYTVRKDAKRWRSYFIPSSADMGVVTFRRWLDEKAGGDVGWAGGASSSDLPPQLTTEQLRSSWERHTKDCSACKQAIATITKVKTGLTVAAGGLLLVALFTTAQYRSAISDTTLIELGCGAALLVAREALARWQLGYYVSTGPVYNFRKKPTQ
ncbi:hypothetical protein ABBQ32_003832 [Trebouxia sp. C0010 RCD-2024]